MKADQSFFSSSLASVASSPWPPLIHVYGKAGTGKTWSLQNYYHRAQPRNLHFFYLDALLFTHAPSWLIWQHIECGFRTKWSGLDHATGEMPPLTGSLKSMADLVQKLKAHFDLIQKQEKALIQVHLIVDHCDALRSMENGLVLAQLMRLGEWMVTACTIVCRVCIDGWYGVEFGKFKHQFLRLVVRAIALGTTVWSSSGWIGLHVFPALYSLSTVYTRTIYRHFGWQI